MVAPRLPLGRRLSRAVVLFCGLVVQPVLAAGPSSPPLVEVPKIQPSAVAPPAALAAAQPIFGTPRDYPLMAASQPTSLLGTRDGGLWFAASGLGAIGRLDRASGAVTYYPLGIGARPYAIAEAPDRSIYAVDRALNVLHRLNPETGEATRVAMPGDLPFLDLAALRIDHDGKIWFSGATGWLGSHDPASGQTDVSSHEDLLGLAGSASGPNGAIWFVAGKSGRMIRIEPRRSRHDSMAVPADVHGVRGLAAGPNGEVWIAAARTPTLARYSGRGSWLSVRLPWPDARPQALVVRADGMLFAADVGRRKLIRYHPVLERFDEVGDLGTGGTIRAMIDLGDAIAIADMGADRIRVFPDDPAKHN